MMLGLGKKVAVMMLGLGKNVAVMMLGLGKKVAVMMLGLGKKVAVMGVDPRVGVTGKDQGASATGTGTEDWVVVVMTLGCWELAAAGVSSTVMEMGGGLEEMVGMGRVMQEREVKKE